ncbi:hypothetical protein [Nocardioides sp.]|uniref:hypothetical protein n=1 Tax=Nocardioides sp. TaxID=35761 RepID=UPI002B275D8C|nr:hypothetical protein [Nocardioides sp.]
MEHQEYVAARHARLVEHAIELGWPHRTRRPRRSRGSRAPRSRHARTTPQTLDPDRGATVAVLAIGLFWAWRQQQPTLVPSVFAYDVDTATRTLEDAGYRVTVEATDACEPRGLALSSDPQAGSEHGRGREVLLRSAIPAGPACLAIYRFRSEAWMFVAFTRGGAAPPFAREVRVYVDGVPSTRLDEGVATDLSAWDDILAPVERVATQLAPHRERDASPRGRLRRPAWGQVRRADPR